MIDFEKIARLKLRFESSAGNLTVEQLFDLPLTGGGVNLDDIARGLHRKVRDQDSDGSFVTPAKGPDEALLLAFDVVKAVIASRVAERDALMTARDNAEKKRNIMAVIAQSWMEREMLVGGGIVATVMSNLGLERYLGWRGCGSGRCMLMIGVSGLRATVKAAIGTALSLCRSEGGVNTGTMLGEKWKAGRFRNVYLRNAAWLQGYAIDTCETAVDWPRVPGMMAAVEQAGRDALAVDGERVHAYTHLSHLYAQGASVYSTFVYRLAGNYEQDLARWQRLKAGMCRAIVANGGTISHQHGVGSDHAPYLAAEKGELGMSAMRHLFAHFDPDGMMNPGKLLLPGGQ